MRDKCLKRLPGKKGLTAYAIQLEYIVSVDGHSLADVDGQERWAALMNPVRDWARKLKRAMCQVLKDSGLAQEQTCSDTDGLANADLDARVVLLKQPLLCVMSAKDRLLYWPPSVRLVVSDLNDGVIIWDQVICKADFVPLFK